MTAVFLFFILCTCYVGENVYKKWFCYTNVHHIFMVYLKVIFVGFLVFHSSSSTLFVIYNPKFC